MAGARPGKVTCLTGRSGSGKTTLLQMMAGLLTPDGGSVMADGKNIYALSDEELSGFQNQNFGMIPQGADLLGHLTVMENLLLPRQIYGKEEAGLTQTALVLLEKLGIKDLSQVPARELSGGERRRVCAIRALLGKPAVIFADEPTSDLDEENLCLVLDLLKEAAKGGTAVLIVTHDLEALKVADSHYRMQSGVIEEAGRLAGEAEDR